MHPPHVPPHAHPPHPWPPQIHRHPQNGQTSDSTPQDQNIRVPPFYWTRKQNKQLHDTDLKHYNQFIVRDLINTQTSGRWNTQGWRETVMKIQSQAMFYNQLKNKRLGSFLQTNKNIWGEGYKGYGNGWTGQAVRIVYPDHHKNPTQVPGLKVSSEQIKHQAKISDVLVPIRLEFTNDRDNFQLRDTFVWNLNETVIPLEFFVYHLSQDFDFDKLFSNTVLTSIKDQLIHFRRHEFNKQDVNDHYYYDSRGNLLQKDEDMRILIKLDITSGSKTFVDQFEWDINNPDNNPEEFASVLCDEMSLSGEFSTAISHSIREQCQIYTQCIHASGFKFDGRLIEDEDIRGHIRPTLLPENVFRLKSSRKDFGPSLTEVGNLELHHLERERDRDTRRKRRAGNRVTRRGIPIMPDLSDMPRTFRTPIYSSLLPGGVIKPDKRVDINTDQYSDFYDEFTSSSDENMGPGVSSNYTSRNNIEKVFVKKAPSRLMVTLRLPRQKLVEIALQSNHSI